MKTNNEQKHESELNERLKKDGVDYEEELRKRKKLEIESRKDNELICVECDKLSSKIAHAEERHGVLVEQ